MKRKPNCQVGKSDQQHREGCQNTPQAAKAKCHCSFANYASVPSEQQQEMMQQKEQRESRLNKVSTKLHFSRTFTVWLSLLLPWRGWGMMITSITTTTTTTRRRKPHKTSVCVNGKARGIEVSCRWGYYSLSSPRESARRRRRRTVLYKRIKYERSEFGRFGNEKATTAIVKWCAPSRICRCWYTLP